MQPVNSDKPQKSLPSAKQQTFLLSARKKKRLFSERSLLLGLCCLASLGLLSKGMAWAQAEMPREDAFAPAEVEGPAPEPEYIEPAPAESFAPEPEFIPEASAPAPEPEYIPEAPTAVEPEPEYIPEAPTAVDPEPEYIPAPEVAAPPLEAPYVEAPPAPPASTGNAYIDPTDYSIGATQPYEAPTAVEFSERSTGCEAVIGSGQEVAGTLCAPPPLQQPVTAEANPWNPNPLHTAERTPPGETTGVATANERPWLVTEQPPTAGEEYAPSNAQAYASETTAYSNYSGGSSYSGSVAPIQVGPISITSTSSAGLEFYNVTARPEAMPGNGNTSLLFPLSIPSPITSVFGWRTHPVLGHGRFHTGTDLGAPLGTPVIAAFAGQVAIADWLGGYGLTVVLDHSKRSQETLYAHLSEIFVKPGEWVQQGEAIGRVGSTGMSTGPHLHFEVRQLTSQGGVATDPGTQLEFALAQMVKGLQTAKNIPAIPQIVASRDLEGVMPKLPPLPPGLEIEVHNLIPPALTEPQTLSAKPDTKTTANN